MISYENYIVNDKIIKDDKLTLMLANDDGYAYYQGNYDDDYKFDNYGKLWDMNINYQGFFKNGVPNGKGCYKYNGTTDKLSGETVIEFNGYFLNGLKNGKGKEVYKNGDFYVGMFSKNVKHGKGILYNSRGCIKIEGKY